MNRLTLCLVVAAVALCSARAAFSQYGDISDVKVAKPEDKEDVQSTPPPEGATVLFDGKSLDAWCTRDDKFDTSKPAGFELKEGGAMQVNGGDIMTKERFSGPFRLHVEFRTPYMPKAGGQGKGNSGVYLQGRYEVQVLDSYGIPPDKLQQGDCGGIYGVAKSPVNACKAPTVWQSYDIEFYPPKFDESGKKTEPARATVIHNGVKIHDNKKIDKDVTTSGMATDPKTPGPIMLQDHGNPVQFRNIWIVPLKGELGGRAAK